MRRHRDATISVAKGPLATRLQYGVPPGLPPDTPKGIFVHSFESYVEHRPSGPVTVVGPVES